MLILLGACARSVVTAPSPVGRPHAGATHRRRLSRRRVAGRRRLRCDALPARLDSIVRVGLEQGAAPGAAHRRRTLRSARAISRATAPSTTRRAHPRVDATTMYDLASLTKVVATTTAAMILEEEGKLDISRTGAELPPRVRRARQGGDHGAHAAHAPRRPRGVRAALDGQYRGRADYLAQINARPLTSAPGTKMVYSDWDFILMQDSDRAHHRHHARRVRRRARLRAARHDVHALPPRHDRRRADAPHRADRAGLAARPDPRHGARSERVGAGRRVGTRRPVLDRARPRDLRADAARTADATRTRASSRATTIARWTARAGSAFEPRARMGHAVATSRAPAATSRRAASATPASPARPSGWIRSAACS